VKMIDRIIIYNVPIRVLPENTYICRYCGNSAIRNCTSVCAGICFLDLIGNCADSARFSEWVHRYIHGHFDHDDSV
jgi:hypothetical protein